MLKRQHESYRSEPLSFEAQRAKVNTYYTQQRQHESQLVYEHVRRVLLSSLSDLDHLLTDAVSHPYDPYHAIAAWEIQASLERADNQPLTDYFFSEIGRNVRGLFEQLVLQVLASDLLLSPTDVQKESLSYFVPLQFSSWQQRNWIVIQIDPHLESLLRRSPAADSDNVSNPRHTLSLDSLRVVQARLDYFLHYKRHPDAHLLCVYLEKHTTVDGFLHISYCWRSDRLFFLRSEIHHTPVPAENSVTFETFCQQLETEEYHITRVVVEFLFRCKVTSAPSKVASLATLCSRALVRSVVKHNCRLWEKLRYLDRLPLYVEDLKDHIAATVILDMFPSVTRVFDAVDDEIRNAVFDWQYRNDRIEWCNFNVYWLWVEQQMVPLLFLAPYVTKISLRKTITAVLPHIHCKDLEVILSEFPIAHFSSLPSCEWFTNALIETIAHQNKHHIAQLEPYIPRLFVDVERY